MMDIRVFDLPVVDCDNATTVEKKLYELEKLLDSGEELDPVERDWMDRANTWLIAEWSNINASL